MSRVLFLCFVLCLIGCAGSPHQALKPPEGYTIALEDDLYPLDGESRKLQGGKCPQVQLIDYAGDVVPYRPALRVNPFFRERLQQFEIVVAQVAVEVYGRPPVAIRHYGAYLCRRIRSTSKMSEHGLGNAIDVWGFDFEAKADAPAPIREAFGIVLLRDWDGGSALQDYHAVFLRKLVIALAARPDIFRGMLGPGAPDHDNHFHLDVGRSRFINIKD